MQLEAEIEICHRIIFRVQVQARLLKPASRVERVAISEYINHVIGCDGINVQINKCSGSTSRQRGWQNLHPRDFSRMSHQILRIIFNLEMVFTKHICEWLTQVLGSGSGPAISKSKLLRLSSHGCMQERTRKSYKILQSEILQS
jgi:hypothetical protein